MFLPNIDTLIFSALTKHYNAMMKPLLPFLEEHQQIAKIQNKNVIVILGDQSFEMLPNGARNYKFILHNSRYEIKLQVGYNEQSTNYPILIRLKSEFLWEQRDQAYYKSIEFIEMILGKLEAVKMSRVDLCCHTDKIKMNKLKLNRFVTRSTSKEIHVDESKINSSQKTEVYLTGRNVTGLSFGKLPIRCRIYDKNLEIIQSSKKTWFKDIWAEHGITNEIVVNVEFQLKREFFKIYKIDTYEELNDEIKSIWTYLTTKWLRYVNLNHSRVEECKTNKVWEDLQHAYDNDWRSIKGIERHKQKSSSRDHILNMIRCYMINDAAHIDKPDFATYAREMLNDVYLLLEDKNIDFEQEVLKKQLSM